MVLCPKAWKSRSPPGIAAGAPERRGLRPFERETTHLLFNPASAVGDSAFATCFTARHVTCPSSPAVAAFRRDPVPPAQGRHNRSTVGAGWSSPVARQAHNLKVVGSNPTPATNSNIHHQPGPPPGFFMSAAFSVRHSATSASERLRCVGVPAVGWRGVAVRKGTVDPRCYHSRSPWSDRHCRHLFGDPAPTVRSSSALMIARR